MTLTEFKLQSGLSNRITMLDGLAIWHGPDAPAELWHLTDFRVSSVSGGSVILRLP